MHIFGHSELYQSFWEKLLGKIWNGHFWPFQIYTKNCQKKFGMAIFGLSKFIPVFLGEIVGKNLEWPFLAFPNLYQSFWVQIVRKSLEWPFLAFPNYQSFWEKLLEKIWNGHFWPFQIYTSLFGENCCKKFRMAIFGHSKFTPVFLGKIVRKNSEWPFRIAIFGHSKFIPFFFGNNCQKKFRMAIFSHSEFFLTMFLYISL